MSELAFQIFARVYPVTEELLYAGCLALFFRPFLPESGRWQRLLLIVAADLLAFLFCSGVTVPQGTFSLLLTALMLALSLSGVLALKKREIVLLSLLYWNVKNSSALIVVSLDTVATRLWIAPAGEPAEIYLRSAVLLTLLLLSHALLLSVMLHTLRRRLCKRRLRSLRWRAHSMTDSKTAWDSRSSVSSTADRR